MQDGPHLPDPQVHHFVADLAGALPGGLSSRQRAVRRACVLFNVLCGLTNGYDICVTSSVLEEIARSFSLCDSSDTSLHERRGFTSCPQKQAVLSLASAGSLCAKLLLTWTADRYGRRLALALVDCLIILAVCMQCLATSASALLAGRFLLGTGLGLAFVVEPAYVCEVSPPAYRGLFVVLNEVAVCVGCLLGLQVAALLLAERPETWRTAVALGGLPATIQLLFLGMLPESPRWLAVQGDAKGLLNAAHVLGLSEPEVDTLLEQAAQGLMPQGPGCRDWRQRLDRQKRACGSHSNAFLMAFTFAFFCTASGIFGMQAYAHDILRLCGVERPLGLLPLVGWAKLIGSLGAAAAADRPCVGRRRLAVAGSAICVFSQLSIAMRLAMPRQLPTAFGAFSLFLFIFAWNLGYGSLQFVVTLEVLPNEVRSVWAGQIFGAVGLVEVIIYQVFETMLQAGAAMTFLAFAAVNALSVLFAARLMSELSGKSLEEAAEGAAPRPEGPVLPGEPADSGTQVHGSTRRRRRYNILEEAEPSGAAAPAAQAVESPTGRGHQVGLPPCAPPARVLGAATPEDGI